MRDEKGCRGDVDTVAELMAAEKKREDARKKKAETIRAITKKVRHHRFQFELSEY